MADDELLGAGMGDNLLNLAEVYKKSAVASDNHWTDTKVFLHLLRCGAEHIRTYLTIMQVILPYPLRGAKLTKKVQYLLPFVTFPSFITELFVIRHRTMQRSALWDAMLAKNIPDICVLDGFFIILQPKSNLRCRRQAESKNIV